MAIVFKAKEKQLDHEVAIKVLPFSLAFDKEFVERFQREARTSAKLEHPNIIPIYRVGKSGRVIYFVMKFLRGKPLSTILAARGSLPPLEIKKILAEVARALAYAHKKEIVHRDIKPDNIMFDEHGHAVVTDFGIAKAASGGKLTGTGMSIGTPHYMSPEQAKAQPLDGRSDIYSLGVVAYQCLTGTVPFDGEATARREQWLRRRVSLTVGYVCLPAERGVEAAWQLCKNTFEQRAVGNLEKFIGIERKHDIGTLRKDGPGNARQDFRLALRELGLGPDRQRKPLGHERRKNLGRPVD